MKRELQHVVQPGLRSAGFSGAFPHYRKIGPDVIDLVTFQFDRNGGGFVIEIARCSSKGLTTHWGKHIPPEKVNAWDLHPSFRKRVQPSPTEPGTAGWFRYDECPVEQVAIEAKELLEQVETWSNLEIGTAQRHN